MNLNRRKLLLAAVSVPVVYAASGLVLSYPAFAQALPKLEQVLAATVNNAKSRLLPLAANDNAIRAVLAAEDTTILRSLGTGLKAVIGSPFLKALGVIAAPLAVGGAVLTIFELMKQIKSMRDSNSSRSVAAPSGSLSKLQDIFDASGGNVIVYNDYLYIGLYGGGPTASTLPVLTAAQNLVWSKSNVFSWNSALNQYPVLFMSRKKVSAMNSADLSGIFSSAAPAFEAESDAQLAQDLSAGTSPAPFAEVQQAVVQALTPYLPVGYAPVAGDVPDFGLTPADFGAPVPATVLDAAIDASSSSSSSSASSQSSADGVLVLPPLPRVPEPPEWFDAWRDQLYPLLPKIPAHSGECPALTFQLPDQAWPRLTMKNVTIDQYCGLGDQLRPTLRTWAQIGSSLTALFTILRA